MTIIIGIDRKMLPLFSLVQQLLEDQDMDSWGDNWSYHWWIGESIQEKIN